MTTPTENELNACSFHFAFIFGGVLLISATRDCMECGGEAPEVYCKKLLLHVIRLLKFLTFATSDEWREKALCRRGAARNLS